MSVWAFRLLFPLSVALFAVFPLTDTDIWWHLAAARDFLENGLPESDPFCWTPSKSPWINVHLFFELGAFGIFSACGAAGLVAAKAFLWGVTAFLWIFPLRRRVSLPAAALCVALAFLFRYSFECRPILLTMLFLGIFWNLLPGLSQKISPKWFACACSLICTEWLWVRTQGLFPLGFALAFFAVAFSFRALSASQKLGNALFFAGLLCAPLWHFQGRELFFYPAELLNRLVGGTSSAQIFSRQIAENRAPATLLLNGENVLPMLALLCCIVLCAVAVLKIRNSGNPFRVAWLAVCLFLAALAERNLALFFFPFVGMIVSRAGAWKILFGKFLPAVSRARNHTRKSGKKILLAVLLLAFVAGSFARSLAAYFPDGNFEPVSKARVPFDAAEFLAKNPTEKSGKIFNDDRSGGFLEWRLPGLKTAADGRFILKNSEFLSAYLGFAENPESFFPFADSEGVVRVLLPVRYFTIWTKLANEISLRKDWKPVYADDLYVIWDRL